MLSTALAALAQDNRLDIYRLLVQAGTQGMAAGRGRQRLWTRTKHADLSFRSPAPGWAWSRSPREAAR